MGVFSTITVGAFSLDIHTPELLLVIGVAVMPVNVFVSFVHEDQEQMESFRALAKNPNHSLVFHDRSLKDPVVDRKGTPLPYPPHDPRSRPVRKDIKKLLDKATRMVVLVGDSTHKSNWVNWEIKTFYDKTKRLPGKTRKRMRAIKLKGCVNPRLPKALKGRFSGLMNWGPVAVNNWLDENPNV